MSGKRKQSAADFQKPSGRESAKPSRLDRPDDPEKLIAVFLLLRKPVDKVPDRRRRIASGLNIGKTFAKVLFRLCPLVRIIRNSAGLPVGSPDFQPSLAS